MEKQTSKGSIELGELLPMEINGWEADKPDKLYDPETIFDYIDGAGEVYRSFNFKKLLARDFTKPSHPRIIADLFDMGSSKNAYGVFTHDLEGKDVKIGQGSTYKGGLLSFWKGRFFVSLYAEEETEETRKILLALGHEIASAIEQEGQRPAILSFFPPKNLKGNNIRFFTDHLILNYHYFVADQNILLFDQHTEAALAEYEEEGRRYRVLLVQYPTAEKAQRAHESFIQSYMPEGRRSGIIQTENGRWTAVQLTSRRLIIVFDALSKQGARTVISRVEKRIV